MKRLVYLPLSILILSITSLFSLQAQTLSWQKTNSGSMSSVMSMVSNGSTLVAGTLANGVYVSPDLGNTWISRNGTVPGNQFEVYSLLLHNGDLYAGTNGMFFGGVYKSTDFGLNWTDVSPDSTFFWTERTYAMVIVGNDLFIGTGGSGAVYKAPLNNLSVAGWSLFTTGMPANLQVRSLAYNGSELIAGTVYGGVYRSSPSVASWSAAIGTGTAAIDALAINGSTLFAGNFVGTPNIFSSINGGASWTTVPAFSSSLAVSAVFMRGDTVLAGTYGINSGVEFSSDAGITWNNANQGFNCQDMNVYSFSSVGQVIFAGSDCGIWRTSENNVGINDYSNQAGVRIFPNPVKNVLHIEYKTRREVDVAIYSCSGKLLLNQPFSGYSSAIELPPSFENGLYFLQLKDQNNSVVYTGRFLVE